MISSCKTAIRLLSKAHSDFTGRVLYRSLTTKAIELPTVYHQHTPRAFSFHLQQGNKYLSTPPVRRYHESTMIDEENNKAPDMVTMVQWSYLSYALSNLRMIVREHKDTPFEAKDLILTQNAEAEKHLGKTTYLTHAIPVKNVIDFIDKNKKYLKTKEAGEVLAFNPKGDGDNVETKLKILDRCEKVSEFDAEFLEINDEMADKCFETELVYSIVVNRSENRLTLIFKGSDSYWDFLTDLRFLKKRNKYCGDDVKIHAGFHDYLFGDIKNEVFKNKFERITATLKEIYSIEEYKNYDLYVTGHSLGGALAQVVAFALARDLKGYELGADKVTTYTYASPRVGNYSYQQEFVALEKEAKLRHIRVSNHKDFIATAPTSFYYQTGVDVHAQADGEMAVDYLTDRSVLFQLSFGEMHKIANYSKNVNDGKNSQIVNMDAEEMYKKYAEEALKGL